MSAKPKDDFVFEKTASGGYSVFADGCPIGYVWKVRSKWQARSRMGTSTRPTRTSAAQALLTDALTLGLTSK